MNILIPHSWLKDFLKTSATPEKIAECLSLCGPSIERVEKVGNDYVYDIEVTTNRVDMMSVMGIAREAATILPQFNIKAKLIKDIYQEKLTPLLENLPKLPLKIKVDHQLCPRFTAVLIKNITLKPSPKKITKHLEASGIRSINNIVDISNYLMRAYGQPVHTFDFDKIKKSITLRLSKTKETITTLDNKTFSLTGNDIIIEDGTGKLIDLCGIMGGLNSAVDQDTKNVLLFVQVYSPSHIRHTSMSLAQRSEAAQLFEKKIDPELVLPVIHKGIKLFKEFTGGEPGSQIIDLYPNPLKKKLIKASLQLIKQKAGINLPNQDISNILTSLGLKNKIKNDQIIVTIPSYRHHDINIPEDLVEEVARIYGYYKINSQLMSGVIPTNYPNEHFDIEYQIKTWLAGMGLNELYTNSMVSENLVKQSEFSLKSHLKIKNALSEDWTYLRRSLIPSHLEAIKNNSKEKDISFFEIANTYHSQEGKLPQEKLELIIISKLDYLKVKGILDNLMNNLHLKVSYLPQETHADITINNQSIGKIGPLKSNSSIQVITLDLRSVLNLAKTYPSYKKISTHPPIIEDLTFTLPDKTYLEPIINTLKSAHPHINSVSLGEIYKNNFTFKIVYQADDTHLTDHSIAPIRKKLVNLIKVKHHGQLVGKI